VQRQRLEAQYGAELLLRSRNVLTSMTEHCIPLLMGVLGAFAFMLRTLTMELRNHTRQRSSAGLALIRVCLGAIAGVFGVALLADAEKGPLVGISPLVVPFLFGYGIEIVFSVMDRIVQAFNGGEPKAAAR